MPVILATQEAEIRRMEVQSQPRHIVLYTYLEKTHRKKKAGGVAQSVNPEFIAQHH
jgi:transposase